VQVAYNGLYHYFAVQYWTEHFGVVETQPRQTKMLPPQMSLTNQQLVNQFSPSNSNESTLYSNSANRQRETRQFYVISNAVLSNKWTPQQKFISMQLYLLSYDTSKPLLRYNLFHHLSYKCWKNIPTFTRYPTLCLQCPLRSLRS
jgi:hypothetical protein